MEYETQAVEKNRLPASGGQNMVDADATDHTSKQTKEDPACKFSENENRAREMCKKNLKTIAKETRARLPPQ